VLEIIDNQVRSLRKRQVIDAFKKGERTGAYWGIRTNVADYGLADPFPCPVAHDRDRRDADAAQANRQRAAGPAGELGLRGLRRCAARARHAGRRAPPAAAVSRDGNLSLTDR
jgi:hypothetical protein